MNIDKIIDHFGGVKGLCIALNVYPQSIYQWKKRKSIPLARQYDIEMLTQGKFIADRSHLKRSL